MPCSSSTSWSSTTASDPDLSPMAVAGAAAAVDAVAVNDSDAAGDSSPIHSSSSTASRGAVLMMKGKRTKRRRMLNLRELSPTPPPPATPPPALPPAASAAAGKVEVNKDESIGNASPASSSSACQVITTSTAPRGVGVDEEEEDLAMCLMLLAQGRTDPSGGGGGATSLVAPTGDEQSLLAEMQVLAAASTEPVVRKRRRRPSVLLAATSAAAGGGFHDGVYECKTCNKRFSSFQALGGHRTSHTKPGKAGSGPSAAAAALEEDAAIGAKPIGTAAEPAVHDNMSTSSSSPSQLLQLVPGRGVSTPMVSTRAPRLPRSHECSICHAEFSSGQALGGHMRRHRPLAATSAPPAESTTSASTGIEEIIDTGGHHDGDDKDTTTKKNNNDIAVSASTPGGTSSSNLISLDLNLPAPVEADEHSHRMKAVDGVLAVLSSASTASASGRFPLVAGKPPVSVFGPRSSSSAGLVDCLPLLS